MDLAKLACAVMPTLRRPGLLLVSASRNRRPNVMAIGWGLIGNVWGIPMFVAAVRPSRYTHDLIEATKDFTVNVPAKGMDDVVSTCGSISGRQVDKFKETGLIPMPSRKVKSPIIKQCIAHLECSVLYQFQIEKRRLPKQIKLRVYPHGNYHDIYFGRILKAYADKDYESKLP